ncbi:hypothetical protein [Candidatus Nitrospira bockiana]
MAGPAYLRTLVKKNPDPNRDVHYAITIEDRRPRLPRPQDHPDSMRLGGLRGGRAKAAKAQAKLVHAFCDRMFRREDHG